MPAINKRRRFLTGFAWMLLAALPGTAGGQVTLAQAADLAERRVMADLAELAYVHCTESVIQEKLTGNGHTEAREQAKYDYLVMIDGNGDNLLFNESRQETMAAHHKQLPMLVTNGFSTLQLIFHPYYRNSFNFESGAEDEVGGEPAVPVYFSEIAGQRAPAALALRGRVYPLSLKGTAWLDKQTGDVVKMDASLLNDMSDVGLRSLSIHVEYKPVSMGKSPAVNLPAKAVVELETPRQHWRNTHIFDAYKRFSAEAEQDSKVTIIAPVPDSGKGKDKNAAEAAPDAKEKP
jgi:hypothetical protein